MTIQNNPTRNQYAATSGQTVFNYNFEIIAAGDIVVFSGATLLTISTDYTLTGVGTENGGTVTLVVGATTGDIITIYRATTAERLTDYQNSGDFLSDEVNADFDRIWAVIQEQSTSSDFFLQLKQSTVLSLPFELDEPVASSILRYKADLSGIESVPLSSIPDASTAADLPYDNATSILAATDVQDAIDEVVVDIASNTADIASNTADIASNTADIATNTADIATNTADIASNTTYIEALSVAVTGTATFTNATNNIALVGFGAIAGLEVGDVYEVTGTASNNKLFTVEVITDADNVIVNQAHAGGATSKSLVNETVACTITLVSKWKVAPLGLGQGEVNLTTSRALGVVYTANKNRSMSVYIAMTMATGLNTAVIDGIDASLIGEAGGGNITGTHSLTVGVGSVYTLSNIGSLVGWVETR